MIEIRNRKFLYFADDLLKKLEEDYLFDISPYKGLGPMTRRDSEEGRDRLLRISRMEYWMRGTYVVIGCGFLVSLVYLSWLYCASKHGGGAP
jgi:hypothetical protein